MLPQPLGLAHRLSYTIGVGPLASPWLARAWTVLIGTGNFVLAERRRSLVVCVACFRSESRRIELHPTIKL